MYKLKEENAYNVMAMKVGIFTGRILRGKKRSQKRYSEELIPEATWEPI
jgi:hypothetical protein